MATRKAPAGWKAASGYGLTDTAFHPSSLTYWRRRLSVSGNPHRIMAAIAAVIAETGVVRGKRRRTVDSTVLDDAVARQETLTQLNSDTQAEFCEALLLI